MEYVELQVTTNFTFLSGGSHPDEFVDQAAALGYKKIAITDRNTLAGIVRAYSTTKDKDISIIPACRLDLLDGPSLLAYPTNRNAYASLSGLLSKGNLRTEKGKCHLYKQDVYEHAKDIKFIVVPPASLTLEYQFEDQFKQTLAEYRDTFGKDLYLGATRSYQANDNKKLYRLSQLSNHFGIPLVANNDVHYHTSSRRELQDVITCIREKCTIYTAGYRLYQNAERYLKPIKEMQRLFSQYPGAIARTNEIAEACQFSLKELEYEYPEEIYDSHRTPHQELTYQAWKGAKSIYKEGLPEKIVASLKYELKFMKEMKFAKYFLTVYDIVREARERRILCQGRGSAANSTVCYCLGITSVDPMKHDLLFERFISSARNEPPDIDIDFEHERREEMMQYVYNKYGRNRSAIVATVTHLHQKGALRDVAKAMGLSVDAINRLSSSIWEFTDEWFEEKRISSQGFDPNDPHLIKVLDLTRQFMGFPRQLGQHTGGFVITQRPITELCPILNARMENRTCIEWNKDDIDALGFLKVDMLALGMLTCIRKAFDLGRQHYDLDLTLANIPQDDPAVYHMIGKADTIGVFQIESRAQQTMLPRLKPQNFYDLVIEVAIVRPGPIQGDMVHPYLRRRKGLEPVEYPSKELEEILGRTLGVPLFQEQAMKIAIVAAGFTPAEADKLRRSMATFKLKGLVSKFGKKLIDGMLKNGYTQEFAERVFKQLEGFGSYGFPESHAASFALLVYVSSWIKCYYPDVFAVALLNSWPMGFYHPAQIIIDARKHGVEVYPVDVNHSYWDNSLEDFVFSYRAIRLGFRLVKGLRESDIQILVTARRNKFTSIVAIRDAGVSQSALERLADADAFNSMGLNRRQAMWEVAALDNRPIGMFIGTSVEEEQEVELPGMLPPQHVFLDYAVLSLSTKGHPVSFVRDRLTSIGITLSKDLANLKNGMIVRVAGLVLVRQRPGTAGGVCFMTMEDEAGFINLVFFESLFDKYRREILQSTLLTVEGKLQIEEGVIHVIARDCYDRTGDLREVYELDDAPKLQTLSRADEKHGEKYPSQNKRTQVRKVVQGELFPAARNFR
jgi:error-prone DNA polymerase